MLGGLRFRPLGWLVAACTSAGIAVAMVVAAPSGASGEKVYESETTAECIIAPGVLNEPGTITIKETASGPSEVAQGEQFQLNNSKITVTTPAKWGEDLFGIGARQARGFVTDSELETEQATPSPLNIATPPEFATGLPFTTPVKNEAVTFTVPSASRTFVAGPVTVTGASGNLVVKYDPVAGFVKTGARSYESTHKGIQFEFNGYSEPEPGKFEEIIGPLETSCSEPKASVLSETPIVPATVTSCGPLASTTTSTTSGPPAATTTITTTGAFTGPPTSTAAITTSCTTTRTCPSVTSVSSSVTVEPAQGPASGGTTVILSGPGVEHAESVSFGPKGVSFERLPNGDLRVVTPPGRGKVRVTTSGVVIVAPPGCPQERYDGHGTFTYEPVGGTAGEKMVDLGTLGGEESEAQAVNDAGQVVGTARTESGYNHAFSWTQSGGMVDLGTLGRTESRALAVNDSGQVVGVAYNCPLEGGECSSPRAFSWTQAGGIVDLGTLGGSDSEAVALNGHGEVVGYAETSSGHRHAFSWTQAGGMVDLGTFGGQNSRAEGVNEAGEVVGAAEMSNNDEHAFSWTQAGGMVDLGTLGGGESFATAISRSGQIVGDSMPSSANRNRHAFSWTRAGGMVDLGTLGGNESYAHAVNDSGQVVGSNQTCPEPPEFGACGSQLAFSWTPAGGMVGLGTLGGNESDAVAVNDSGQVVGQARTCSGGECPSRLAFSWTPAGGMVDLGTLGGNDSFANAVNDSGQVVGRADTSLGTGQAVLWNTAQVEKAQYKNWVLSGSLSDRRLAQTIALPTGSTFSGSGEVNQATGAGSVSGKLAIPPFTAPLKLFGVLPVKLGMTLSPEGSIAGTVAKSETISGDETLTVPVKLGMGVTSVSLPGLKIPTTCATAEPLSLSLVDNLTREELLTKGWSFAGTTTLPRFKCEGFLGPIVGFLLTALISGPENPYAIKVTAPSG